MSFLTAWRRTSADSSAGPDIPPVAAFIGRARTPLRPSFACRDGIDAHSECGFPSNTYTIRPAAACSQKSRKLNPFYLPPYSFQKSGKSSQNEVNLSKAVLAGPITSARFPSVENAWPNGLFPLEKTRTSVIGRKPLWTDSPSFLTDFPGFLGSYRGKVETGSFLDFCEQRQQVVWCKCWTKAHVTMRINSITTREGTGGAESAPYR